MAMTAKYLTKRYEGVWKGNYLFLHSKATAEEIERAWQAYKANWERTNAVSDTENNKAEAEFDTNGVSVKL